MDERWEVATAVLVNVAYTVAVLAIVLLSVPSLRAGLAALGGRQAHAWRYGRWLASRTPTPEWTTLLERNDLPAEAS